MDETCFLNFYGVIRGIKVKRKDNSLLFLYYVKGRSPFVWNKKYINKTIEQKGRGISLQYDPTMGKYQRVDLPQKRKRNPKRIALVLAIVLLVSVWAGIQFKNGRETFFAVRLNWGVSLPTHATLLYEAHSESGFHGDGERYHVFQYYRDPDFSGILSPIKEIPEEDKADVLKILSSGITVDDVNLPDFERVTLERKEKRRDNSRLYLYYVESSKRLYIIEHAQ